jgi:transcriptional regulator with XRE-family HTH domain
MNDEAVNPLLEFRLAHDWSLDRTAREMGVSISTIIRTEQGCYADIPPAILRHLITHFISGDSVRDKYSRYQIRQRTTVRDHRSVERQPARHLKNLMGIYPQRNPMILWREEIMGYKSRLAFCKDLCLHPSTVKRVEDGQAHGIPMNILQVMEFLWITEADEINDLYTKWRQNTNVLVS